MHVARRKLTDEEKEEREALYCQFYQEARRDPMAYFAHDANAHLDDALRALVMGGDLSCDGPEAGYLFWVLTELLTAKKDHCYDVSTRQGWELLALDLSTCGCAQTASMAQNLVMSLVDVGLLDAEAFNDSHLVMSERVCKNASKYAADHARRRVNAEMTNRKRSEGAQND